MEQTPSSLGRSPELPSVSPPSVGEVAGGSVGPEHFNGTNQERKEQQGEAPVAGAEQTAAPPVIPYTPITVTASSSDDQASTPAVVDPPAVANDDDLIEKEWVEKAKKILTATKDDPYRREQEVSRLQADYLQKRYGRSVGSTQ